MITWADFEKIDIRVGTILEAKEFPKAKNPAYQLTIDFGELGIKKSCFDRYPGHRSGQFSTKTDCQLYIRLPGAWGHRSGQKNRPAQTRCPSN